MRRTPAGMLAPLVLAVLILLASSAAVSSAIAQEGTEEFSTDETRRLEGELADTERRVDELELAIDRSYEKDAWDGIEERGQLQEEQRAAEDRAEVLSEDLVAARLDAIRRARVEGSERERLATLEAKQRALEALDSWAADNVSFSSDVRGAPAEELEVVEDRIAAAREEQALGDGADGAPGGAGQEAPVPQADDTSGGGLHLGPVLVLLTAAFLVAWRAGLVRRLLGPSGDPATESAAEPHAVETGGAGGATPDPGQEGPAEQSDSGPRTSPREGGGAEGGSFAGPDGRTTDEDEWGDEWSGGAEDDEPRRWGPPPPGVEREDDRMPPGKQSGTGWAPAEPPAPPGGPAPRDPRPALARFARDLTSEATAGNLNPIVGREGEIARVVRTLSRTTKNNPVLIGDAGVGKTAIAEGLAQRISAGKSRTPCAASAS